MANNQVAKPKTARFMMTKGTKVELWSPEEVWTNAWFPATVTKPPTPAMNPEVGFRTKRNKTAVVRYDHMVSDADSQAPLDEEVNVAFLRPTPPPHDTDHVFEEFDVVDGFYDDVWWTGYVARIETDDRYTVAFKEPPDVVAMTRSELRPHRDWVGGSKLWVTPPKEKPNTASLYSLAMNVEIVPTTEDKPGNAWLPCVYLGEIKRGLHMVKCRSERTEREHEKIEVRTRRIRPRPPKVEEREFQLLEKVDALRGSVWTVGVVIECLPGKRYRITFRSLKKELEFNASEIRPHMDWIKGQWVCQQDPIIMRKCEAQNKSNEIIMLDDDSCSLNGSTSSASIPPNDDGDDDNINEGMSSDERVAVAAGQEDVMEEEEASDDSEDGKQKSSNSGMIGEPNEEHEHPNDDNAVANVGAGQEEVMEEADATSVLEKSDHTGMICEENVVHDSIESPPENLQLAQMDITGDESFEPRVEDCAAGRVEIPVPSYSELLSTTSAAQDSQVSTTLVVSGDGNANEMNNSLKNANGSGASEATDTPKLPFEKCSKVWKFLESTEVFVKLPQNPHFQPLLDSDENVREGLALAHMINFESLVLRLSTLEQDNHSTPNSIDAIKDQISSFETHGFDLKEVVGLLDDWRKTLVEIEDLREKTNEIGGEIRRCTEEETRINGEVDEISSEMAKLGGKRAELEVERTEYTGKRVKLEEEQREFGVLLSRAMERSRFRFDMR